MKKKIPKRKAVIDKLIATIEEAIPRLDNLILCDEMESHVETMYSNGLINLPRYNRWKQGIANARNIIIKGE